MTRKSLFRKYALVIFKTVSAVFTGLLIALAGQALFSYRYFSFMFIFLTAGAGFFSLTKKLGFLGILLVDLLFVFVLILIKVYIMMADTA